MPTLLNQLAQGLQVNGPTFVDRQLNRDLVQTQIAQGQQQIDSGRLNQIAEQLKIDQVRNAPAIEQQRAAMRQALGGAILGRLPQEAQPQFEPFLVSGAADPALFEQGVRGALDFVKTQNAPPDLDLEETRDGFATFDPRTGQLTQTGVQAPERKPLVVVDQRPISDKALEKARLAEATEQGKDLVAEFREIRDLASASRQQDTLFDAMETIPVETGLLEGVKANLGSIAQAFGVPLPEAALRQIGGVQSFIGIANQLVLSKMLEQKGPQTAEDARRIKESFAQITNLEDANKFLVNVARSINRRRQDQEAHWREWRADEGNGSYDGAAQAWDKKINKTPLFGVNKKTNQPVYFYKWVDEWVQVNPPEPGETIEDRMAEAKIQWRKIYGKQ